MDSFCADLLRKEVASGAIPPVVDTTKVPFSTWVILCRYLDIFSFALTRALRARAACVTVMNIEQWSTRAAYFQEILI